MVSICIADASSGWRRAPNGRRPSGAPREAGGANRRAPAEFIKDGFGGSLINTMLRRLICNPAMLWSAARRRLRDALPLDAWLGNGRAWLPSRLSIDLTYACNAECEACCQRGKDAHFEPRPPDRERMLEPDALAAVIGEARAWRPTVYLTGGEPLLHPDLGRIIGGIKAAGLYCSLNTNGSLLSERAGELCAAGVDKVIVSVEPSEGAQAANRGVPFSAIRAGLAALRECERGPEIALNCVITPRNWRELDSLAGSAAALGASNVALQHFMFSSRALIAAHRAILADFGETDACYGNTTMDSGEIDAAAVWQSLRRLRASGLKLRVDPPVPEKRLRDYYSSPQPRLPGLCLAPWTTATVMPDGGISLCRPINIGMAGRDRLRTVWNGEKARRFRRALLKQGQLPGCARCCSRRFS